MQNKTKTLDKWEKKLVSILNYEKDFKAGKLFFRSKWEYGVFLYKLDLAYNLFNNIPYFRKDEKENYPESIFANRETLKKHVLNGAKNFKHYSEGGCSLVFWDDIASRLCTDYERKKYPNRIYENAVSELQPRALSQAFDKLADELLNA